jgi:putative ABC transport system permease protein
MRVVQELVWAARSLARRPVSAAGIALTLALGIGIPVGMFSILYGVVLQPLPYPRGHDIVVIHSHNPESGVTRGSLTPAEAVEGLAEVPGFERTAFFHWGGSTYIADGAPRSITSLHVSGDYFSVFGITPALGRTLGAEDVRQGRDAIVLSHAAWMNLTGGDPDAIGSVIPFKDEQFELVGVLPEAFAHPGRGQMIYRPVNIGQLRQNMPVYLNARYLSAVGRLLPAQNRPWRSRGWMRR